MQRMTLEEIRYHLRHDLTMQERRRIALDLNYDLLCPGHNTFPVRCPDGAEVSVDIMSVMYFHASGDYVKVMVEDGAKTKQYFLRATLQRIGHCYAAFGFRKVGREYVINPLFIDKNYPGEHYLLMKDGTGIRVPQRKPFRLLLPSVQPELFGH